MNVNDRKMFKPRPARNQLNQLGGIMASSPQLVDTVTRFQQGGPVRIPIQALADVTGRGFTIPTSGNMPVPYNPGFTTPGGMGGAPVSQGPTSRAQRDPTRPVPSNRSLLPLDPPQQPQQPRSMMQGIQQLLMPTAKVVSRAPVLSAIYGGGRAIADPLSVDSVDVFEPRSVMGIDPTKRRDREFFLEDFDEMSEEKQQLALDAANESRGAGRALATAGRVAGAAIDPLLELGQDVFNMDVTERRLETAAARAQQRNRPLTMEEYRSSLLSRDPERNERERAALSGTPDATAADTPPPPPPPPTQTAEDLLDSLPNASDILDAPPENQAAQGKVIQEEVTKFLGSEDVDEDTKNDVALTLLNKKAPDEKLSKKERIEKNREAYRELFGMDPEKDKQIDGYNLAMMGFLIASGDSPNALQNIARGAAAGLQNFQKTAEKRQSREDKLTELAVQEYQNTLKSEQAQEQFQMNYSLKVQELEDRRAQAETKAEEDRFTSILGLMNSPAAGLALLQLDKQDVDVSTPEGMTQLNTLTDSIIAENPALAAAEEGTRKPPSVEQYVSDRMKALEGLEGSLLRDEIARELNVPPEALNRNQAINFFRKEYQTVRTGETAGSPPPAQRITLEPDAG